MHAPPSKSPATASAFADWVFRQHHPSPRDFTDYGKATRANRLAQGSRTHLDIELFLHHKWTVGYLGKGRSTGWSLYFADNQESPRKTFKASRLNYEGVPLRCIPDLVLIEDRTGEVMIIERKTTFIAEPEIPRDGWPNVEAQLWCYSWIDEFLGSPKIHLVGQLWTKARYGGVSLCHRHPSWIRGNSDHETRCGYWFNNYGGRYNPANTS